MFFCFLHEVAEGIRRNVRGGHGIGREKKIKFEIVAVENGRESFKNTQ